MKCSGKCAGEESEKDGCVHFAFGLFSVGCLSEIDARRQKKLIFILTDDPLERHHPIGARLPVSGEFKFMKMQ